MIYAHNIGNHIGPPQLKIQKFDGNLYLLTSDASTLNPKKNDRIIQFAKFFIL